MRIGSARAALAVGGAAALWPLAAGASSDFSCDPSWTLAAPTYDCDSQIVIGPGNDTRVNLLLLMRDAPELDGQGLAYVQRDYSDYFGRSYFDWDTLAGAFYPDRPADPYAAYDRFQGSRCQSVERGGEALLAAAARNAKVSQADRGQLEQGRRALVALCEQGGTEPPDLPRQYASPEAREFGTYLAGAAAFYAGDWRAARERFASLRTAKDPWVREAGIYMEGRNDLAAANAPAVNEWGSLDLAKADKAAAARAARSFAAYVEAFPRGAYAASATGLQRRAWWLGGDIQALGAEYARLLGAADPRLLKTSELIEEIDDKFLFQDGAAAGMAGPELLATYDLMRMRTSEPDGGDYARHSQPQLTAAELAAQAPQFAGREELFQFLQATQAFYLQRDYRAVLRLIPDDARRPRYSPLQFSRQVLRGMALAELKDRNEAGFWQELLGGAKGLYQRPSAELGLALNWEKAGQVAKVFAAGSPIEDRRIRGILLTYSAGPEVLRAAAAADGRPQAERDLALTVLLAKELTRGAYAAALADLAKVRPDAPNEGGLWDLPAQRDVPVGLFTRGTWSDGYPCPPLRQTLATLAANPRAPAARLCLGDFWRLNGFDDVDLDPADRTSGLGGYQRYPGTRATRARIYPEVLAQPGVSHGDAAYALYRAVYCYAPSGNNTCGGPEVPESQRRAWFRRLKGEFADTRWGQEIEYYW